MPLNPQSRFLELTTHSQVTEAPPVFGASPEICGRFPRDGTSEGLLPGPPAPLETLDFFLLLAAHVRIDPATGELHGDVLSYRDLVG
jgi:hypothetical protein